MDSFARDFTILVAEDQDFIASEFDDAVRRNGGRVLGPANSRKNLSCPLYSGRHLSESQYLAG
jgi:hypothetical protein